MKLARNILGLLMFAVLLLTLPFGSEAQNFGNEWIKSTQRYYKITTGSDGIYRITYDDIINAGIPINTISPTNLQLFHRGKEHAIDMNVSMAGVFQQGDFIEFYGRRNDGYLDSSLYVTPESHTNKYYSLFSDSTAYFLTWDLGASGKRINTFYENNILGLPAEAYHLNEAIQLFNSDYSIGLHYPLGQVSAETYLSAFDHGEGWTGSGIGRGQYRDIQFSSLDQAVSSGPKPVLELLIAGRNNLSHNVSIEAGADQGSLRTLQTFNFNYYYDTLIIDTLEWSDIGSGSMLCRVRVNDLGTADRVSITYAKLKFADGFDHNSSSQKYYYIPPSNSNRSYVEIQNIPQGSKLYDVTDNTNIEEITFNTAGSVMTAMIKNDSRGRKLLLTSQRQPHSGLKPVKMRNINTSANFIIITNRYLRKPHGSYSDPVAAYGAYRASVAGGSYDTLIMNIDELFNQFSYGECTPLAIHQFAKYLAQNTNPQYIFIVGKGLTPNYNFYRKDFETEAIKSLVPTGGFPGSDILFTAGLKGTTNEAGIPIGRIAVKTPAEVVAYLEKVVERESLVHNDLWHKELVHLSGGSDIIQQALFKKYVNDLKLIAEDEFLGGSVKTISKKGSGTSDQNTIPEDVNAGKLMITFFGHSATGSTDLDIGYVSNPGNGYDNKGKYPFLYMNGCIAGDMYNTGSNGILSFGEDWINTPEKGAIGFLAHSGSGLTALLKWYSDIYYSIAFSDSLFINKSIGEIQKEVGQRYLAAHAGERNIAQVQQMALQGDPSLTIFGANKPDYEVNNNNVFEVKVDGQAINVFSDFKLAIIVRNFGITHYDSLQIAISRSVEDGTLLQKDTLTVKSVYYSDTIYYDVLAKGIPSAGNNKFSIHVDPLKTIAELDETNNFATYSMPVLGDLTKNVAPYHYAIVNSNEVTLISQALDVLGGGRNIRFELDTTDQFNSPYRQTIILNDRVVAKWDVNLFENLTDSDTITFYWRTQFEDQPVDSLKIWNTSSFTYINSSPVGWAMNHFAQFHGNEMENVELNLNNRSWEFTKSETRIQLNTYGADHPNFGASDVRLVIGNTEYIFPPSFVCRDNTMNFVAFDKQNTVGYLALGRQSILYPESCGRIPQIISNFRNTDIENSLNIEKYVDEVSDGDFVLGFSIGGVSYENWPVSTLSKLEEIGVDISVIQNLTVGEPVIILGKKGMAPGEAQIITADYSSSEPAIEQEILLDQIINGQAYIGKITSPRIGPASNWISFMQRTKLSELPQTDNFAFNIYGIDSKNNEDLLIQYSQLSEVDLQGIDVSAYPFLRLEMIVIDAVNLTPPQLTKWMVFYEGVPEGILTYKPEQAISGIEKDEGESQNASFNFDNISDKAFADSVLVQYSLFNLDSRKSFADTIKIKPLAPNEAVDFIITLETLGKVGKNDLNIFANPYVQREQDYNNNYLNFPEYLLVNGDNTNPILEVTVDGEFIMDGDIVAPSPMIVLRIKDENKVLLKEDTTGINMYLNKQCDNCTSTRISFSSPNLIWTPGTAEEDFKVEYQPDNLEDGIYTLKAEASDASGNASGTEPYAVNFEVVNESQITNFFPYPNPFSTRTQFVFTLTGSEIPDDIIIQIMTVNGTVVREITKDEIGPIKIGHNKTEYAWDGRDEYGDQLANGVYLYQVKLYTNGKEMKHRATSADRAFKNGFGKLYLLK